MTNSTTNTVTVVKGARRRFSRFQVSRCSTLQHSRGFPTCPRFGRRSAQRVRRHCVCLRANQHRGTYTMEGDPSSDQHMGIIPRACQLVFDTLLRRFLKSKISVWYLEIYNEQLSDLLVQNGEATTGNDKSKSLRICATSRQNGSRVTCMGLSTRTVASPAEVLTILNEAKTATKLQRPR